MEQTTLCIECKFAERVNPKVLSEKSAYLLSQEYKSGITGHCLNGDAPVSDYVHGFKCCTTINNKGDCEFFVGLK